MQCVLLAAGYATRLYPLTENMPKALLKLGDKTILEMVDMILDGCKDLAEAKEKVQKLIENQSNKKDD